MTITSIPSPSLETTNPTANGAASVIIVCTNDLRHLPDCLPSVLAQRDASFEVILVDNGSTDGSVQYVESHFPTVRIIRNGRNLGYTGANNRGMAASENEYVVVLNPDTAVEPDWLSTLINGLSRHTRPAIATSKVLFFDRRAEVNTCGNDVHITGLSFCRGLHAPSDAYSRAESVAAISGCAFAARRDVFERIGLFDEDLFMTMEDTDLSIRARLAGYDCLLVPESIVYHKYGIRLHERKFFLLERNRWWVLLKYHRWRTLLVLLPALCLTEQLTWAYAAVRGRAYLRAKAAAWVDLARSSRRWRAGRARAQQLRRVPDAALLEATIARVPYHQLTERSALVTVLRFTMDPLYALFRQLALWLVRW
jgi:GT2 family glycosyltransferase